MPLAPDATARRRTSSARTAPSGWPIGIPDLASRLRALPVVTLAAPDDAMLRAVLVKLFADELTTNESYVLLHRPEDEAREDLQELARWILKECRVA